MGDCMLAAGFVSYLGAFDQARNILYCAVALVWGPGCPARPPSCFHGLL